MNKKSQSERRQYTRAKRALKIEYRLYKHKGVVVDGAWQTSVTENMSIVGILFKSDIHCVIGDVIELRVVMSGILDVFRGFGRVVRVEKNKKNSGFLTAITFVDESSKLVKTNIPL